MTDEDDKEWLKGTVFSKWIDRLEALEKRCDLFNKLDTESAKVEQNLQKQIKELEKNQIKYVDMYNNTAKCVSDWNRLSNWSKTNEEKIKELEKKVQFQQFPFNQMKKLEQKLGKAEDTVVSIYGKYLRIETVLQELISMFEMEHMIETGLLEKLGSEDRILSKEEAIEHVQKVAEETKKEIEEYHKEQDGEQIEKDPKFTDEQVELLIKVGAAKVEESIYDYTNKKWNDGFKEGQRQLTEEILADLDNLPIEYVRWVDKHTIAAINDEIGETQSAMIFLPEITKLKDKYEAMKE